MLKREQAPDIAQDPVRQSVSMRLLVVSVVEYGAMRELPAC